MTSTSSTDSPRLTLGDRHPIERIVVPITPEAGHDRGIGVAMAWAARWQLPVKLLAIDTTSSDTVDVAAGEHLARTRQRLAAATHLEVEEEMLSGPDVVAALAAALSDGDLVTMTSGGATAHPSPGATPPSASHAWRLVQAWRGPVLMVGPNVEPTTLDGPVVIGLDGSPMAEQSLDLATELASALGARVWLVEALGHSTIRQVEQLHSRGEAVSASAYLRQTAARLETEGQDVGWELVQSDDPVAAVAGFAQDRKASVIVLSTHGSSGLRADVFGSTCLAVVAAATAPVLVSVPEGPQQGALSS